jgi:Ca2+-binding RTX toxin-like protein
MIINSFGGNDSLTGTGFDDLITGGLGADSMFGGNGADTFIFATGDAPTALVGSLTYDKIGDFSATADKIDLSVTPTLGAAESKTATLGGLAGTVSIDAQGKIDFTVELVKRMLDILSR